MRVRTITTILTTTTITIITTISIITSNLINPALFVTASSEIDLSIIYDTDHTQPYNVDTILNISVTEFMESLSTRTLTTSSPLDIYDAIIMRYEERTKINKYLQYIVSLSTTSVVDEIQLFVDNFNIHSFQLSDEYESDCKHLMDEIYDADIFLDWRSVDDIETTKQKIDETKAHSASLKKTGRDIIKKTVVAATMVASAPLTGDIISPYIYVVDVGTDLWSLLSSVDKQLENANKKLIASALSSSSSSSSKNHPVLSKEEKNKLNEQLYRFSKFYCANAFNLQLIFNDNKLIIEGDRIDYTWMIDLIKVIDSNIDMQVIHIGKSVETDTQMKENENTIKSLLSIKQRFGVLKKVIQVLYDLISFATSSNLSKKTRNPTQRSLDLIKDFFHDKLSELSELLIQLKQRFPQKEAQLQKTRDNLINLYGLQQIEQELIRINHLMQNNQKEFESMQTVENMESYWKSKKTLYKGYFRFLNNNTELIGDSLEEIIHKIIVTVGKGPLGAVKGVGHLSSDLVWYMISSLGGWIVSLVTCCAILFSIGGTLYMIRTLLWVISGIIQNIYTILSYIFKQITRASHFITR